ncbi:MAG: restriction endonuclease subunit S [Snowella sp.]|nr:restriction endonuclease subunit S [Snowella sp.]
MSRYQAYEKYKDSGVEWLGEIPEHWNISRIKFIGNIKYGLGEPPEKLEDGLPIIRATDIYRGIIDGSKVQKVNPDKVPWSRKPELKSGDILVVRSGAYTGDSAIVTDEWAGAIAGYDMVITPTNSHPKYIAWNLLGKHILEGQLYLAKSRAAQPHLNAEELGNTILSLPLQNEQEQIANFLDHKTKQIDDLIAKKEALLAKLDEKRTAIISHAVTKGLDPTVPMKDSGINWLGNIPKHWEVKRLKNIASCNDEALGENTANDYEIEYVDISSVNLVSGITQYENMIFEKAPSRARRRVKDGDTIISTVRTYLKAIASIKDPPNNLIVSTGFAVIRPKNNINSAYIGYLLQSEGFIGQIVSYSSGVSYPAINASILISLPVVEPSQDEQKAIAKYLDKKTVEIDLQKAKVQEAIERLKEYRTALITNAVTGKIDVRQVPLN